MTATVGGLLLLAAGPAAAQSDAPEAAVSDRATPSPYAFGMRVGGYGFRNTHATEASEKWNDCRMNGVGVFGQRELGGNAFVEAGSDIYFSDNFLLGANSSHGESMDRLSGLFSAAAGLRMFPTSRISAFAQIGVGLELTRVVMTQTMSDGHEHGPGEEHPASTSEVIESTAMPLGFVGFGADVRLGSRARVGMNFRTYLMAHYDHGEDVETLEAEPEAANQVQFYLRYSL